MCSSAAYRSRIGPSIIIQITGSMNVDSYMPEVLFGEVSTTAGVHRELQEVHKKSTVAVCLMMPFEPLLEHRKELLVGVIVR